MKRSLTHSVVVLALAVGAFAAPDEVFDGAQRLGTGVAVPVAAQERPTTVALAPAAAPITSGFLGLYPEDDFVLGTGRCALCRAPEQGKWYFMDDVIATPKSG